jgi:enoyl-CoA hydratase/carnithine racemase
MDPVLITERHDDTIVLTLNRPQAFNAINTELRRLFIEALEQANSDESVGAVIVTGAGNKAFCAGQDLTETARYEIGDVEAWLTANHAMYRAVRLLDKPAVAAFNGVTAGAGLQIGLCCDVRIGYPDMRIGQPEIKAGLASIVGSQLMIDHIGMAHNVELSLSGELISGQRAYEIGLINRLVPQAGITEAALEMAGKLLQLAPTAMRLTKQRFRSLTEPGFESALKVAIESQKQVYAAGEPQAAMQKFLKGRKRS